VDSLASLAKYLNLEKKRGYDNRSVLGGLSKILPSWKQTAYQDNLDPETLNKIIAGLETYDQLSQAQREHTIETLLGIISQSNQNTTLDQADAKPATPISQVRPKTPAQTSSLTIGLDAPMTVLSGIGGQNAALLAKLGIHNLGDFVHYYPRRYDDYSQLKPINQLKVNDETTIIGVVQNIQTRQSHKGKTKITEAIVSDSTGFVRVTWFNQPWLEKSLQPKMQIVLSGKVEIYLGKVSLNNPDWELLEREQLNTNRIVPVYPLTAKITQKWLRKMIYKVIHYWAPRIEDYLPPFIRESSRLIDLPQALLQVHFPDSQELLSLARHRLGFDEIFVLQMGLLAQKRYWQSLSAQTYPTDLSWLGEKIEQLPFPLTSAQTKAIEDIRNDFISGHPMNRLLQGDVGSGKTVVAAMGIAMMSYHQQQSALMAPTSILAEQHLKSMQQFLTTGKTPILRPEEIVLLIGDTPAREKTKIRNKLISGEIKLLIGTHALLEQEVQFANLQFVVIDEQHRFGVEQRALLREKGNSPHLLVMTATPIPRSMALTVFGDLDVTVIDELPPGRQEILTTVISPVDREMVYSFIHKQTTTGHQAFIIYPLVEQNGDDTTRAAVEEQERLQTNIFPHLKVGLMHGRLKPAEKDKVMKAFRNKEFDVLVSTSVVEVGVDVPNATVMVIESANRFGLAQLHQFRGRVGRGPDQSYCFLLPETDEASENERLSAMCATNDGFLLAEKDLQQRGPGDFLGTRQSGYAGLKLANITDVKLIEMAREQAKQLFKQDPNLEKPENQLLKKFVDLSWRAGAGDVS